MARIVTYECRQCGSEIVVTEALGTQLSPIYCCGMEVASAEKMPPKPKKKAAKKATKKGTKKKVAKKKKPVAKKKAKK